MSEVDLYKPRPFFVWSEDIGNVLWWRIPISEPPYVGTPLDLGRSVHVQIGFGLETIEANIGDAGGWPFKDRDIPNLWWTPLPDAKRIEDQVPF